MLIESLYDSSSESEETDEEKLKQMLGIAQLLAKKYALVIKACDAEVSRIQERMVTEGAPNFFQYLYMCGFQR